MTLGEFLVLLIGGKMVLDGTLTLGELTRFNMYLVFLYAPLRWMSMFPRRLADCTTSLVKIYEILDEEPQTAKTENDVKLDASGALELQNVTFGYKSYEPVLKNVSLSINPGEMIGLVGHSGAGKSTVINLCMRLYDPGLGKITIGGVDIKDISQKELRDNIGVVFQETYLFSGSVFENIAYNIHRYFPALAVSNTSYLQFFHDLVHRHRVKIHFVYLHDDGSVYGIDLIVSVLGCHESKRDTSVNLAVESVLCHTSQRFLRKLH
jgi:ABC-type multidrug transport system fused ATPase/permease subunit